MAQGRSRLLVAACGYGKTHNLHLWYPSTSAEWRSTLDLSPGAGRPVVFDDLPALTPDQAHDLLAFIEREPVAVSVATRHPLPVPVSRLVGRGLLTEVGPADLAMSVDDTAELLAGEHDLHDPDLADLLHEATAGWPALVRVGARMLAAGPPTGALLPWLATPDGPLAAYVRDEVLADLPQTMSDLLRDMARLEPVAVDLAVALGHPHADHELRLSRRAGVVVRGPVRHDRIVPVVAEVCAVTGGTVTGGTVTGGTVTGGAVTGGAVTADRGTADRESGGARQAAAAATAGRDRGTTVDLAAGMWYRENGLAGSALKALLRAGEIEQCGQLLEEQGVRLLSEGHAALITEVLEATPQEKRTREQQLLLGDALRTGGQSMKAGQAYAVIAEAEPEWDAGLAWRMGQIHYHRGDSRAALKAFSRARETARPSADQATLLAWRASAHLQQGETATALEVAEQACRQATAAGDETALATAYVSLALCHSMTGNYSDSDELSAQALAIAERLGNVVVRSRVLTSRTYRLIGEARYAEAVEAARQTGQCALLAGHSNLRLLALCNEADALLMLGRYAEAVRQYERAQAFSRRMGSRRSAAAQLGLGEVYRRRGWTQQARAAYEGAIQLAEESGLNQVHVCALAGLARTYLPDDITAAAEAADRAAHLATDRVVVASLLAKGWVALHRGEYGTATGLAIEAAAIARAERDRAGLAECLELRAAAEPELRRARAALREASAIWSVAGAAVEAARVRLALGRLAEADTDDRLGALLAAEELARAGVPVVFGQSENPVVIRAFGRFEVCLNDEVVPPAQWQSRKARDLLRILVARRGRPVPRGELCELLWSDDDPGRTGHRLSVLLSIVRGVLDPARSLAVDHYLIADQASIGLDVTRLRIDVEDFLADVGHGRRLRERGSLDEAHRLLSVAVQSYRADVFEDEPYAEWSNALREEARAAYVTALRMLAQTGRRLGRHTASVGHLLRLLTVDPYDEGGHRALIESLLAGGQHGEARRAHGRYVTAMRAIGVRPSYQYQEPMQML